MVAGVVFIVGDTDKGLGGEAGLRGGGIVDVDVASVPSIARLGDLIIFGRVEAPDV